ncbi:MAG: hypothetical protein KC535_05525 [Nanoarchaeota archaeon]|nr:hypothetical protein [Nanoarchaeota archaeon]
MTQSVRFLKKKKATLSIVTLKISVVSVLVLLLFLFSFSPVLAADSPDLIFVNSANWEDVYSSLLYGSLTHTKVIFFFFFSQTNLLLNTLGQSVSSVLLVESDTRLSPSVSKILDSLGYQVTLVDDEDVSLYFANLLDADSYVVVDKNFPSNGLSVASFAAASQSWVFFEAGSAIDPARYDLLRGKEVISYGAVSPSLLRQIVPKRTIDEGNRYKNSVSLAKLFLSEFPTKQYVLTQGDFLEEEMFVGSFPVLIVGVSSTPKPIEDFFIDSSVESAVVVGQASVPPSISLKRLLESSYNRNLKLVAKLGQTSPDTQNDEIIPLNTFPLPSPKISLSIDDLSYNQITRQLEVRFSNDGDVSVTYAPLVTLVNNGQTTVLEPEQDFFVLERSESRTLQFPVELSPQDELSATVTTVFGESEDAFDESLTKTFDSVPFIRIADESSIIVQKISYSMDEQVFFVTVKNNGSVPAYVDIDLLDIIVGGEPQSFSSPRAVSVPSQQTVTVVIYGILSSADLLANPVISYTAHYGQRSFALIKTLSGDLSLDRYSTLSDFLDNTGILVGVSAAIIFAVLLFLLFRKKGTFVCLQCGASSKGKKKRCPSCGFGRFKRQ